MRAGSVGTPGPGWIIDRVNLPDQRPALVLLDLDGTLTDSAPGITGSMRAAFEEVGLPSPDDAGLRAMVGPPLLVSLAEQGVPDDRADEVITAYRRHFREHGMLGGNSVFDGIDDALDRLGAAGIPMAVATSKPQRFAREIAEHFGLARHFVGGVDGVFGADDDGGPRSAKADVIAHALASLAERGLAPDVTEIVMVGDREHDVNGAKTHGIPTVAVAWGYADPGEVEEAGAVAVVQSPAELVDLLLVEPAET